MIVWEGNYTREGNYTSIQIFEKNFLFHFQLNQSLVPTNTNDTAFPIDNSTAPDNNNDNNNNSLPEIITDPGIKIIYKRSDDGPFWAVVIIICAILYICYSVCCFACSKWEDRCKNKVRCVKRWGNNKRKLREDIYR